MKVYNVMIIHCWFLNVGRLGCELSENSFNSVQSSVFFRLRSSYVL